MGTISLPVKTARVVCFSGTGGALRAAVALREKLSEKGVDSSVLALERSAIRGGWGKVGKPDLLVLVFAVHAFDAPTPVYEWVAGTDLSGVRGAVVSVSAGGETWPNTGCRNKIIGEMENKGCLVFYERMLIMPCNWVVPGDADASIHLLRRLPGKAVLIAEGVLSGVRRRTGGRMGFARAWVTARERKHAHRVSRAFRLAGCTGCGWCARLCPTESIQMKDGRPVFGQGCVLCFRCIYGCPNHAICSRNFMVLQKGFDLDALEKRMQGAELKPVKQCCKGWAWKAVREYLREDDK